MARKRIIYVDFQYIEKADELNKLQERVREGLLTTRERDAHIFWMDIAEGLKTLTRLQRICFVSHLIKGYREADIAERLGISQPTVHEHIEVAKEKMKYFLGEPYKTARK